MTFYTCPTCKHVNGVWRIHCQCCGTIPAQYSMTGKPQPSIVALQGCERAESIHQSKAKLVTVELDYYADSYSGA